MMNRRTTALISSAALTALLLTGCAGAQTAIDQAQGVVDDTQSLVDSAASLTDAPAAIEQACRTALDGLVPGTPADTAQEALATATAEVDAALGLAGSLPVVSELRDVLFTSAQSVLAEASAGSLASAREAVSGVCDIAAPVDVP